MNQRPFYRSRLFWLGLPGLVFMLWGWWLSMGNLSSMQVGAGMGWGICQSAGDVIAIFGGPERWPDLSRFRGGHEPMSVENARLWKEGLADHREVPPTYRHVIVPYFAMVLAYLAAWLLTLAWWQRRKSRILKLHAAP